MNQHKEERAKLRLFNARRWLRFELKIIQMFSLQRGREVMYHVGLKIEEGSSSKRQSNITQQLAITLFLA